MWNIIVLIVGLLLILEVWSVERLDEVQVEVARRLRRGPLVGRAEEEIAVATR